MSDISIHAPRTGSDGFKRMYNIVNLTFQSTLPARGATPTPGLPDAGHGRFQSTLPARGATGRTRRADREHLISIHAPRTGSDIAGCQRTLYPPNFNPRSPHGERRDGDNSHVGEDISIHAPRTGSDAHGITLGAAGTHFNPRSPHGERPCPVHGMLVNRIISIHAPRTGSDNSYNWYDGEMSDISIHAPRTGSDDSCGDGEGGGKDFNPRSPHGERRDISGSLFADLPFQSTLPARGATGQVVPCG